MAIAVTDGGGVVAVQGGIRQFGTGIVIDRRAFDAFRVPASTAAGTLVEVDIPLTADARLASALFEVIARPVANAQVSTFATVTASKAFVDPTNSGAATVDFGALTTVAGIMPLSTGGLLPGLSATSRWTGTGWARLEDATEFADTATQRLLLEAPMGSTDLADSVTSLVGVGLPAVPSALELQVDGRTVWFERQGSGPVEVDSPTVLDGAGVRYVVDRTDAVRDAFERALASAGPGADTVVVRIGLRAAAPGALALRPQVQSLRVYTHAFGNEGLAHSVDLPAEGAVDATVTPPRAQTVHEVALIVRGTFGPERVQPPLGPTITDAATLTLGVGRTVLIGLPRRLVEPFATLSGVRLRLAGSGQVTGRLLTAMPATPGLTPAVGGPVKGGELTAVTLTAPGWMTLPFAAPVKVTVPPAPAEGRPEPEEDVAAWLELQPAYGEVDCGLTTAGSRDDPPGAPLRRRLPGGGVTGLTEVPAIGPLRAAVRVVGLPDREHPIAAVTLQVAGAAERLPVTPASDDLAATLTLADPVDARVPVRLVAVCAAPGSLVLDTVRVTYTPTTQDSSQDSTAVTR